LTTLSATLRSNDHVSFRYCQRTGRLDHRRDSVWHRVASGYAGAGLGVNTPRLEHIRALGPLPKGVYKMAVVDHHRFAAPCIALAQEEGETYGRSAFYIHGDNRHLNRTASSGCIVIPLLARRELARLMDFYERPRLWVYDSGA